MGRVRGLVVDQEVDKAFEDSGMKSLHCHEYIRVLGNLLLAGNCPPVITVTHQVRNTVVDDWAVLMRLNYPSLAGLGYHGGERRGQPLLPTSG
jgi:hypothetical protein